MAVDFTLRIGDKVALVAPASGQKKTQPDWLEKSVNLLQDWGLVVELLPKFSSNIGYLSATDRLRANSLIQALSEPDIRAVFATRGGYGCARLLPYLRAIVVPTPRFLIGFSDITTLHLHFADTANVISLHAPNLSTEQLLADKQWAKDNADALHRALFGNHLPALTMMPLSGTRVDSQHRVDWHNAVYVGGCLSLLVTSLGTAHEIDTQDKILMIEEIGESPYKLDRMLTHLRNAGKFERVAAVVFGEMVNCQTATIDWHDVLINFFAGAAFPVFIHADFGHGEINLPWHYG
ncbi:MAG: hypothetical protein CSA47_00885 [Gammaproteobacteria bacterium]|nr:MAG: hypothetical protein CSA47_00885 [Gammaproteobacteria bacterium]